MKLFHRTSVWCTSGDLKAASPARETSAVGDGSEGACRRWVIDYASAMGAGPILSIVPPGNAEPAAPHLLRRVCILLVDQVSSSCPLLPPTCAFRPAVDLQSYEFSQPIPGLPSPAPSSLARQQDASSARPGRRSLPAPAEQEETHPGALHHDPYDLSGWPHTPDPPRGSRRRLVRVGALSSTPPRPPTCAERSTVAGLGFGLERFRIAALDRVGHWGANPPAPSLPSPGALGGAGCRFRLAWIATPLENP